MPSEKKKTPATNIRAKVKAYASAKTSIRKTRKASIERNGSYIQPLSMLYSIVRDTVISDLHLLCQITQFYLYAKT